MEEKSVQQQLVVLDRTCRVSQSLRSARFSGSVSTSRLCGHLVKNNCSCSPAEPLLWFAFLQFCSVPTTDCWAFLFSRLCSQVFQATVDYQLWRHRGSLLQFGLGDIPLLAWLLVSLSLMLVVVLNEVVKLHEIRYESSLKRPNSQGICDKMRLANWLHSSGQWERGQRGLNWSHWSFSGCAFATRRDRSCSLRPSWV